MRVCSIASIIEATSPPACSVPSRDAKVDAWRVAATDSAMKGERWVSAAFQPVPKKRFSTSESNTVRSEGAQRSATPRSVSLTWLVP